MKGRDTMTKRIIAEAETLRELIKTTQSLNSYGYYMSSGVAKRDSRHGGGYIAMMTKREEVAE